MSSTPIDFSERDQAPWMAWGSDPHPCTQLEKRGRVGIGHRSSFTNILVKALWEANCVNVQTRPHKAVSQRAGEAELIQRSWREHQGICSGTAAVDTAGA